MKLPAIQRHRVRMAGALAMVGAQRTDGFDARMWIHSAVMGVAAAANFAFDSLTVEVTEPERSFRCLPPASTLAWMLPAAEMGYALHDLRDALRAGNPSFIAHGALVGGFLALLFWLRVAHHLTVVIALHISSIFLNLRRVDFGSRANAAVDVAFAASFVLLRLLALPALWVVFLRAAVAEPPHRLGACMLGGRVVYLAVLGGVGLHSLNGYWGWLIILKLRSKWRDADGVGRLQAEGHYHRSKSRTEHAD
jgi:hypothetical protein